MFRLLVTLFAIKVYAPISIYKLIEKKHWQVIIKNLLRYDKLKTKFMNTRTDISHIKPCKRKDLIPTYAKVSLLIKNGGYKLQNKIA